jgi:hypothetical protein
MLAILVLAAQSSVFVVDAYGGGDFTQIQPAIDAAHDGDLVVVRGTGRLGFSYDAVVIADKAVDVVGVGASPARVREVVVRDLAGGRSVVLSGLAVEGPTYGWPSLLHVADCTGPVLLEQVTCPYPVGSVEGCLDVSSASSVTAIGCSLGGYEVVGSKHGVRAIDSALALYDCSIRGQVSSFSGGFGTCSGPSGGGYGVFATDALVRLEGGVCTGSTYYNSPPCYGGALPPLVGHGTAVFEVLDTTLGVGQFVPGNVGNVQHLVSGRVAFDAPPLAREGAPVPIRVQGRPGDVAFLVVGADLGRTVLGREQGVLHVTQPTAGGRVRLGQIQANGALVVNLPAALFEPAPGPGESRRFVLQAATVGGPTGWRMANPRVVHVVDSTVAVVLAGERAFVDDDAAPGGDGRTWGTAFASFGAALRSVVPSSHRGEANPTPIEVWITAGTYRPEPLPGGNTVGWTACQGLAIHGGFRGDESTLAERDGSAGETRFDAPLPGNSLEHVYLRLGLGASNTFVNGWVSPTCIERVSFHNARIDSDLDLRLERCRFTGAGRLDLNSTAHLLDCHLVAWPLFYHDSILHESEDDHLLLEDCVVTGVRQLSALSLSSDAVLRNCTVLDNGLLTLSSRAINWTPYINASHTPSLIVDSTILYGNVGSGTANQHSQISTSHPSTLEFRNSLVHGWNGSLPGMGVLDANPSFVDRIGPDGVRGSGDEDLRLAASSPCIDAGRTESVPVENVLDRGFAPRIVDDPAVVDVGTGGPPTVDIGAHERQP